MCYLLQYIDRNMKLFAMHVLWMMKKKKKNGSCWLWRGWHDTCPICSRLTLFLCHLLAPPFPAFIAIFPSVDFQPCNGSTFILPCLWMVSFSVHDHVSLILFPLRHTSTANPSCSLPAHMRSVRFPLLFQRQPREAWSCSSMTSDQC